MGLFFEPGQTCQIELPGGVFHGTIVQSADGEDEWVVKIVTLDQRP